MFTKPILLDGATGTGLLSRGMPRGACTETWVLEHPDVLVGLQREYFAAGSRAVLAPTFGASRHKLARAGIPAERAAEVNAKLVGLSRRAADEAGIPGLLVGGDLSPLGLFPAPFGDESFDTISAVYYEQALALERAGVDFFAVETSMTLCEVRAAILAIREVSKKPVICSFTCGDDGKTLSGANIDALLVTVQAMGAAAFGLNCSNGPESMVGNLERLTPYAEIPLIAKPNAGLPKTLPDGSTHYDMSPEEFASYAPRFAALGASVLGGCCGSTPAHIAALEHAMERTEFASPHGSAEFLAANEREVFRLTPAEDVGEPIRATPDFAEDILDAEDEQGLLHIYIEDRDGVVSLEENQYMIREPLCVSAANRELLDAALRVYHGRAAVLTDADPRYGAVRL